LYQASRGTTVSSLSVDMHAILCYA
jgi:hypothetical protein